MLIKPHGGELTARQVTAKESASARQKLRSVEPIALDAVAEADLEMLGVGGYSPLIGFMGSRDRASVAEKMRLASGVLWPIPITLGVTPERARTLKIGETVPLTDTSGEIAGTLAVEEVYQRDVQAECRAVFGTDDAKHPGVAQLMARGATCVAGPVQVLEPSREPEFSSRRLTPAQSRAEFTERGWKQVVGFQTRNPVHRAHEYIIKCALEICDGLFLHPLVGFTKSDDIPAAVRLRCYDALIASVMPKDRVLLSVLPAPMRYAGPREAVLHAIVRKNYGCSHFIVGRDHAGVGSYYGTYDAQKLFDTFPAADIGIQPLRFEHSFFCKSCGQMATSKTCPHGQEAHVFLSGTKVREMLRAGTRPPEEFTRPAIADVLIEWAKST